MNVILDKAEVGSGAPPSKGPSQPSKDRWLWCWGSLVGLAVLSGVGFIIAREVSTPLSLLRRLAGEMPWNDFVGKEPPELPRNPEWLTAKHPRSLGSLRGQVVLLQFSSLC